MFKWLKIVEKNSRPNMSQVIKKIKDDIERKKQNPNAARDEKKLAKK